MPQPSCLQKVVTVIYELFHVVALSWIAFAFLKIVIHSHSPAAYFFPALMAYAVVSRLDSVLKSIKQRASGEALVHSIWRHGLARLKKSRTYQPRQRIKGQSNGYKTLAVVVFLGLGGAGMAILVLSAYFFDHDQPPSGTEVLALLAVSLGGLVPAVSYIRIVRKKAKSRGISMMMEMDEREFANSERYAQRMAKNAAAMTRLARIRASIFFSIVSVGLLVLAPRFPHSSRGPFRIIVLVAFFVTTCYALETIQYWDHFETGKDL